MKIRIEDYDIVIYKSLKKCMRDSGVEYYNNTKKWEWMDADGIKQSVSMKEALKRIKDRKCWGWLNRRTDEINLWIDKDVKLVDLIGLVAHEIGHMKRPFHSNGLVEEQKACKYEVVAQDALVISKKLMRKRGMKGIVCKK